MSPARLAVLTNIEGWYNPRRRHAALNYLSPANYETKNRARSLRGTLRLPTGGDCVAGATPPVDKPALATLKNSNFSVANRPAA